MGGGPGLVFGPLGGGSAAAALLASGDGEDLGALNKAASSLRAGQISTGFLPLGGGSSGKLGGPPPLMGFGAGAGGLTADQP